MRLLGLGVLALMGSLARAEPVSFEWFEYTGRDAVFDAPLPAGGYRNPILAGFYPDPSLTRAAGSFYLVNSSFAYFPGLPVFQSTDLVHWRQIGNAIERASQVSYAGLGVSRGLFAPAIAYHGGTFYIVNTAVDAGGNFLISARNPAGPWSDPVWLREIEGIDPALFFDRDGRAYIVNNGPPAERERYAGHRAIWIQELDVAARKLIGPRKVLVNGGVDIARKPVWIEGPHLFRRGEWVYLMCAEGGTGLEHSEVIFRARAPLGPFEPYRANPILTQRELPAARANPIGSAGHADLVEDARGEWWAVFLATRPYRDDLYNTGRETFLLPVSWRAGWPVILERGRAIPYVVPARADGGSQAPWSGNFTWRDEFDAPRLDLSWIMLRAPRVNGFGIAGGKLTLEALPEGLDGSGHPAFLAHRQQHTHFDASTALSLPREPGTSAGLAAFQNESHWYFLGVTRAADGRARVFLERRAGAAPSTADAAGRAYAARELPAGCAQPALKISGDGGSYSFFYDCDRSGWQPLKTEDDATFLSTQVAGGFVGAVVGPYARKE